MEDEQILQNEQKEELSDIEIAELANDEIKKRDKEIAELTKKLARQKLLSQAKDEEEEPVVTREDCIEVLRNPNTVNYDYAVAVVNLHEIELSEGNPSPLGKNGQEVVDFFKDVIEMCDGDKSAFTSVYQAKIGDDDKSVAMRYKIK